LSGLTGGPEYERDAYAKEPNKASHRKYLKMNGNDGNIMHHPFMDAKRGKIRVS
jgi:hypothetical protein